MRAPLIALGHEIITPTYTGLGERTHLNGPMVDLDLHIRDILGVLHYEDLREIVLLGHSYGGMVATGVADQASERIAELIYLDAFVPEDNQSVLDLRHEPDAVRDQASRLGDGWFIPPSPIDPEATPQDREWLEARRGRQSLKTFEQRIHLTGGGASLPRSYIYCSRGKSEDDHFRRTGERVRSLPGWRYYELDSGHTPNVTKPEALAALLGEIVGVR